MLTDTDGNTHRHRSGLHADTLEVAYDPVNPNRTASAVPLVLEIPRVVLKQRVQDPDHAPRAAPPLGSAALGSYNCVRAATP
ncbi:hypothetical protein [Streptomyces sp. NPDC059209]|uniref:hypothetical protein n=1 Tax=Streptomyces sp. NPDC059209 TaxID=3346769 RepID=UPI00368F43FE